MKKIMVILMLMLSIITFGEVNDGIKALEDEEVVLLDARIKEIEEKENINLDITYTKEKDVPKLQEVEKSVIINFVKIDNDTLTVKLNFTQDVGMENYVEEIEKTLEDLEGILLEGENFEFTMELINSLDSIIEKIEKEEANVKVEIEELKEEGSSLISKLVILALVLLLLYGIKNSRKKLRK